MRRGPTASYLGAFIFPVFAGVRWFFENWLQQQPWWPMLPWGLGVELSAAFGLGLLVQDLYNPNSWLRSLWFERTKLFVIEAVSQNEISQGRLRQGTALLRFVADAKRAELRLWGLSANHRNAYLVTHETALHLVAGTTMLLPLAVAPISDDQAPCLFGGPDGKRDLDTRYLNKVVIELRAGWRRQRETVDIIVRPISPQNHIEVIPESGLYHWPEPSARSA